MTGWEDISAAVEGVWGGDHHNPLDDLFHHDNSYHDAPHSIGEVGHRLIETVNHEGEEALHEVLHPTPASLIKEILEHHVEEQHEHEELQDRKERNRLEEQRLIQECEESAQRNLQVHGENQHNFDTQLESHSSGFDHKSSLSEVLSESATNPSSATSGEQPTGQSKPSTQRTVGEEIGSSKGGSGSSKVSSGASYVENAAAKSEGAFANFMKNEKWSGKKGAAFAAVTVATIGAIYVVNKVLGKNPEEQENKSWTERTQSRSNSDPHSVTL